jgi:hypothetical protein
MGVDPDLVPAGPEEAAALMATIERRQVRPVQAGRELVRPLLTTLDHHIVPGLPAALMRRFLPPGVCDGLEIPRHRIARALLAAPVATTWLVTRVGRRFWRPTPLYRELSMRLLQALLDHDRGGSRPEFGLPDSLHWYRSDGASGAAQRVLVNTARRISKASD